MQQKRHIKIRRPLDKDALDRLAVHYVGRYATTRAKLIRYLARKVGERGWDGDAPPDLDALAERLCALGYVDDAAFAAARSGSLSRRGFGPVRIAGALYAAGIAKEVAQSVAPDADDAEAAAARFAERRRFGAFATGETTPEMRRKHLAAMVRAGHSFDHARRFTQGKEEDSL